MSASPRLFAAIVPPAEVLDSLAAELARCEIGPGAVRWTPRPLWHLTLAFYGNDELDRRSEWLGVRSRGHRALRLRLRGAGTFPGVLWAGVHGDGEELSALDTAVGPSGSGGPFHPHVTVARWKGARAPAAARECARRLAGYEGPEWVAEQLVLMSSELGASGPRYTVRERFELTPRR